MSLWETQRAVEHPAGHSHHHSGFTLDLHKNPYISVQIAPKLHLQCSLHKLHYWKALQYISNFIPAFSCEIFLTYFPPQCSSPKNSCKKAMRNAVVANSMRSMLISPHLAMSQINLRIGARSAGPHLLALFLPPIQWNRMRCPFQVPPSFGNPSRPCPAIFYSSPVFPAVAHRLRALCVARAQEHRWHFGSCCWSMTFYNMVALWLMNIFLSWWWFKSDE